MTDTELLDWAQEHLATFRESMHGQFKITWIDEEGTTIETCGENLRDCIKNAIEGNTWF